MRYGSNSLNKGNNNGNNKQQHHSLRDKYLNAAKEALSAGDPVLYEYNLQFAEHYKRLINDQKSEHPQTNNSPSPENKSEQKPQKQNQQRPKKQNKPANNDESENKPQPSDNTTISN